MEKDLLRKMRQHTRDPVTEFFFFFFGMMTRAWWIKLVVGEQIELSRSR